MVHENFAQIINLAAKAFLFFAQENIVIVLLCIGFFGYDKKKITRTLFILLFSMIVNAFLKSLWKIPLPPEVGTGYAFPSGHMQNSMVLWGWLSLEIKRKAFFAFSISLLCGIAFGLIQLGYHSLIDILGALASALILLIFYSFLLKLPLFKKRLSIIGFSLFLFALPMAYYISARSSSMFIAQGALIGLSLGMLYENTSHILNTYTRKIKSILVAITGIALIQIGFKYLPIYSKEFSLFSCYFLTALWISAGVSKCTQ